MTNSVKYDQPGAGLDFAGINEKNLFARFQKLYAHRNEKEGGSKEAWDAITKNTAKSLARSKSPIALEFQNFLNTGKLPAKITPQFTKFAAESLDYGVREPSRAQQHKESFLNSTFGKILGTLGQVGLGFVPGVGPALSATLGATLGAMNGGGFGGAFLGGLSGYGAGKFGAGLGSAISNTGGVLSSLTHPGAFAHNLWNGSNFLGRTLTSVNNIPGALGAGTGFAHMGNAASNFVGPVKNAFNTFNNTVSNVKNGINTATGGFSGQVGDIAQGAGKVRDAFGLGGGNNMASSPGIFETLFGSKGSKKASDTLYKQLMALYGDSQAKPFDIKNPYGTGANMENGYASPVLSAGDKQTFANFDALINKQGQASLRTNQRGLATEFFDQIDKLASRRDARQFNSLESKLFNSSGVNTGTAGMVADFRNQLEEGRQQRVFQATNAAQNYTTNMFKNFLALTSGRNDFNDAALEPLRVASNISNGQQQGRANASRYAADAFAVNAQGSSNSASNSGSLIDDAIQFFSMFGS